MGNIIFILIALGAAKAEASYSRQRRSSIIQTDKYIETNRDQYSTILKDYGAQIEKFREKHLERVGEVNITGKCLNDLNDQVNNLLLSALNTKKSFRNYMNYYDQEIEDCGQYFEHSTKNYALCVLKVTFATNSLTFENRKAFKTIMETAECMIRIYYKLNSDC